MFTCGYMEDCQSESLKWFLETVQTGFVLTTLSVLFIGLVSLGIYKTRKSMK